MPCRLSPAAQGFRGRLFVKRAAEAAGLDPGRYARPFIAGRLAMQGYLNGAGELAIMRQTGHRSLAMLLRYIRDGTLFRVNPAAKLGIRYCLS